MIMLQAMREAALRTRRAALLGYRRLLRPRVVRHAGVLLAIGDHLSPAIVEWIYAGDYEKSELKAIRSSLEPSDVVLEVGAGLGFISMQCARAIGADRVHTFEANPALEPHIRRNYELNGLRPTLRVGLLGERAGEVDFYVERDFWESSATRKGPGSTPIKVPVLPVNDEVRRIDPTFLIMDIEGGEYDLLRALDGFGNIRKVAIELHEEAIGPEKVAFVRRRLEEAGFAVDGRLSRGQQLFARKAASPAPAAAGTAAARSAMMAPAPTDPAPPPPVATPSP